MLKVQQYYGSFCLRLGAVCFGAGSLVFTGLQIAAELASSPSRAITPGMRLLLITAQMHFIFLNSKDMELARHGAFAKLGLMHMIATNISEWLQVCLLRTFFSLKEKICFILKSSAMQTNVYNIVELKALVEETRHEIDQLEHVYEGEDGILQRVLMDASPFLFPCTIEFNLICAVILFEMWRRVDESVKLKNENSTKSVHHLSIDCGSAHKWLLLHLKF